MNRVTGTQPKIDTTESPEKNRLSGSMPLPYGFEKTDKRSDPEVVLEQLKLHGKISETLSRRRGIESLNSAVQMLRRQGHIIEKSRTRENVPQYTYKGKVNGKG